MTTLATPLPIGTKELTDHSRLRLILCWMTGRIDFESFDYSEHVLISMIYEQVGKNTYRKQQYRLDDARRDGRREGRQALLEALKP